MALLVLDTATETLAVGLTHADVGMEWQPLLASAAVRVPRGHSRLLQPAVAQLFQQTGINPRDLTGIGVGIGPGSYTGVRLGVSTAKAMAFALSIPLYPLSTLAGMAKAVVLETVRAETVPDTAPVRRVTSLLYARRGRAFGAIFEQTRDGWERMVPDQVQSLSGWQHTLQELRNRRGHSREVVVHDFRPQYQLEDALAALGANSEVDLASCSGNFAQGLAIELATGSVAKLAGQDIHSLEPAYALEVEAEVKLKEATASGHVEK